jgi:hypothetical protein
MYPIGWQQLGDGLLPAGGRIILHVLVAGLFLPEPHQHLSRSASPTGVGSPGEDVVTALLSPLATSVQPWASDEPVGRPVG